jgi:hypothetical protein
MTFVPANSGVSIGRGSPLSDNIVTAFRAFRSNAGVINANHVVIVIYTDL